MNKFYLECPEDTCISQEFPSLNTCKIKTYDMKVFNGICFENYNTNNIKIKGQNKIIFSFYSYNGDYNQN